jgi:hypothetical protein
VDARTKLPAVQFRWPTDVPALSQSAGGGVASTAHDFQISNGLSHTEMAASDRGDFGRHPPQEPTFLGGSSLGLPSLLRPDGRAMRVDVS